MKPDEDGELAQLGERLVCNQEVAGSSPVFSTMSSLHGGAEGRTAGRGVRGDGI